MCSPGDHEISVVDRPVEERIFADEIIAGILDHDPEAIFPKEISPISRKQSGSARRLQVALVGDLYQDSIPAFGGCPFDLLERLLEKFLGDGAFLILQPDVVLYSHLAFQLALLGDADSRAPGGFGGSLCECHSGCHGGTSGVPGHSVGEDTAALEAMQAGFFGIKSKGPRRNVDLLF